MESPVLCDGRHCGPVEIERRAIVAPSASVELAVDRAPLWMSPRDLGAVPYANCSISHVLPNAPDIDRAVTAANSRASGWICGPLQRT
ncbi:MAG: hypothetical protein ABFD84_04170, partial [Candidatus Polarisedimenticolia bacterium]